MSVRASAYPGKGQKIARLRRHRDCALRDSNEGDDDRVGPDMKKAKVISSKEIRRRHSLYPLSSRAKCSTSSGWGSGPRKIEKPRNVFAKLAQGPKSDADVRLLRRAKHNLLFSFEPIEKRIFSERRFRLEFLMTMNRVEDWTNKVRKQRDTRFDCPLYNGAKYLSNGRISMSFEIPYDVEEPEDNFIRIMNRRFPKKPVTLNYGLAALLVENKITDEQKLGYINKGWHLSHLCGNWKCLKTEHFHVEPAKVNQERKACHGKRMACGHRPRCLVENVIRSEADELDDSSQQTMVSYTTSRSQEESNVTSSNLVDTHRNRIKSGSVSMSADKITSLTDDRYSKPPSSPPSWIDITAEKTREFVDLTFEDHIILRFPGESIDLVVND